MKKAIGRWCLPGNLSVSDVLSSLNGSSLKSIEWALDEVGEISFESTDGEVEHIAEMCSDAGVSSVSIATGLLWKYSLTDQNKEVQEKGKAIVRRCIDTAAILGAGTVLVVPGVVTTEVGYDKAWATALVNIAELARYAETKKVKIGIENVWNKFIVSPREMREFVDEIGSEYVGVYFDAGNIVQYGIPSDWISTLGKRIVAVHVKGFNSNPGGWKGFVGLLDGDIDWNAVASSLRTVGYTGYVIPEVSPVVEDPKEIVRSLSEQLDIILEG